MHRINKPTNPRKKKTYREITDYKRQRDLGSKKDELPQKEQSLDVQLTSQNQQHKPGDSGSVSSRCGNSSPLTLCFQKIILKNKTK